MVNVLVFEDKAVDQLHPVTLGRPAYAVTCACWRLYDWLIRLETPVMSLVRPHLNTIQRLDFPFFIDALSDAAVTVLLSARLVPSHDNFVRLQGLINETPSGSTDGLRIALDSSQSVVAGVVPTARIQGKGLVELQSMLRAEVSEAATLETSFDAICFPHDLIRYNQKYFAQNLEIMLGSKNYNEVRDGLFAADGANISDNIVVNSSQGPVVVDSQASIGPYCYLAGPVFVGPNCKVNEHSSLKDGVCLADTVKVGGEIEATVIEPYSNKQHHGFLGHAYLGSWINLGAGTCNSDLKNTYGTVKMHYGSTGMQFLGCIMGDYSKTAINTSIFTGKRIGVCSNLYGFVSQDVPSYVNDARSFGEMTMQPVDVMQATQKRMFARRNVQQRPCDVQLIADMFELTVAERPADLSTDAPRL